MFCSCIILSLVVKTCQNHKPWQRICKIFVLYVTYESMIHENLGRRFVMLFQLPCKILQLRQQYRRRQVVNSRKPRIVMIAEPQSNTVDLNGVSMHSSPLISVAYFPSLSLAFSDNLLLIRVKDRERLGDLFGEYKSLQLVNHYVSDHGNIDRESQRPKLFPKSL